MKGFKQDDVVYLGNDKCIFYRSVDFSYSWYDCEVLRDGYLVYTREFDLKSEKDYLESIKKEENKVEDLFLEVDEVYPYGGTFIIVKALYDDMVVYSVADSDSGIYGHCSKSSLIKYIKESIEKNNIEMDLEILEDIYKESVEAIKSGEWKLKDGVGVMNLVEKV